MGIQELERKEGARRDGLQDVEHDIGRMGIRGWKRKHGKEMN